VNDSVVTAEIQDAAEQAAAWQRYPFELVPGDPEFAFPAAEAAHQRYESDTWFIAGELTAAKTGRTFAFLTIFNKNRPGGSVVADFYTMALFDLDNGAYGTYTDYDMPPKSMAGGAVPKLTATTGHMDMTYDGSAGTARWTACRDADGQLVPYTYDVALVGTDHSGADMELRLSVSATRPPVPVGASAYNGRFECLGQQETFSYFQTGLAMTGTLKWADIDEEVSGSAGHIDRQWFPLPAGGGGTGGNQRAISHEWRTIHLDNGVDLVGWRQFDRRHGNALRPFTGATVTYTEPGAAPECVEDIEVHTASYVRWPESVRQLVRPLAAGRYMPDRHTLASQKLDLELTGEPLVPAPAHSLPIEYMEGPFHFRGTMRGEPVSGFGISERSIAMYRDWELIEVLATAAESHEISRDRLAPLVAALKTMILEEHQQEALDYLEATVRPAVEPLAADVAGELRQIIDDLTLALSGRDA
jgi:predicted secreted hydrolase